MRKIAIIGGGGIRTPLLIHALARAEKDLDLGEVALFDIDSKRTETIAGLGREIVTRLGSRISIRTEFSIERAAAGSDFVLNSIRVGGMAARARDERIAIEHGLAGQETTGPGGAAMALRTIPVTLAHARIVERVAPNAWFINFTNPAGLMTQALTAFTGLKTIGICDTPSELFHRTADVLGLPREKLEFDYAGLNHLGWVRHVTSDSEDLIPRLLADPEGLRRLYPAGLFDPSLIATLGLIPSEYLFFYYSQRRAYENQLRAGASRGEELQQLNTDLFQSFQAVDPAKRLELYRDYLLRRNASYLKLEAQAESAMQVAEESYDPFETATGYHRIALDVMRALLSEEPRQVVVNVPNAGSIDDLDARDVVEVPCDIDRTGARPRRTGRLPESVRGLVLAVKAYERTTIRAATEHSAALARLALLEYPIVGQWEIARDVLASMIRADSEHLGYLG
jgi:6-phospho-beta-glucosidase